MAKHRGVEKGGRRRGKIFWLTFRTVVTTPLWFHVESRPDTRPIDSNTDRSRSLFVAEAVLSSSTFL